KTEDELLANMKNKWRYNIRLATKKGVEIKAIHAGDADFDAMVDAYYELYMTTASRDGIGAHPKSYYKDLLERGKIGISCMDSFYFNTFFCSKSYIITPLIFHVS
ncbi:MAG: peptidoglycan bridge formation glycyltransferase FemA/FemB family protein, partial [Treponema sp.]|nr:peptidoglycan bridge formation glycyltransferase FemA/FemB family protein [Treponema sp.]